MPCKQRVYYCFLWNLQPSSSSVARPAFMSINVDMYTHCKSASGFCRMRFGPNFDWVRGGKLPGLCGGRCLTGCKEVTGLDGWSSRQMWRPCVWPPEHQDNSINCEGGKLVAYVYHMFKQHWCGDDFEYSNELFAREYSTNRVPVIPKDFFQPKAEEWYTVWSHVKMNTAGQSSWMLCDCRSCQIERPQLE